MSKVAIVILNYNGAAFLQKFLPSVIAYSSIAEIIIADNNSTDNSLEVLKSEFNNVRTILINENLGFAGGYNHALSKIDAEYFVLLNSDVEVTQNWLIPLIDFLDQNQEYAAVQPKILDYNDKSKFEYAGAAGGFIDKLGYPYCRGRIFDTLEKDNQQYDNNIDVFWCSGASLIIRSSDFFDIGGFDADFFAHMEEIDLCWRLRNKDRKLACIPSAKVFHVGGGTLNKTSPIKTYLNFRNNLTMLVKNLPLMTLLYVIPIRMMLDLLAGLKFWKDQSKSHFYAVLKSQMHFLRGLSSTWKKRNSIVNHRNNDYSILLKYYFQRKKTFIEINNTK
jgi:GT2 family glycosyltransferase